MTNESCVCPQCLHEKCPPDDAESPYDEISHEIENNIVSVKIPKNKRQYEPRDTQELHGEPTNFDAACKDIHGKKCRYNCTRVNVIPDHPPSEKKPEEEMFSLRSIKQIMPNDNLKNTLEIEFKAAQNYVPLPDPGPPPPIIKPRLIVIRGKKSKRRTKKKESWSQLC